MPEGLDIEYDEVNAEIGIHFLIGLDFIDKLEYIESDNVLVSVDVSDDYKDEKDTFKLVEVSLRTLAYMFITDKNIAEQEKGK